MKKVLYLVRGLPGSGKSSFAKELVGSDDLVCEADKYFIDKITGAYNFDANLLGRAHESCHNRVERYMQDSYEKIAVSNTFTRDREMKPYFEMAEKYGYRVYSVVVENRHGGINVHNVPEETLEAMKNRFSLKLI
jgi:predicted kinase